MDANGR